MEPGDGLQARGEPPPLPGPRDLQERRRGPDRRRLERRQGQDPRRHPEARAGQERPVPRGRMRRWRARAGLLVQMKDRVGEDHVVIVAAGVAFSFFLSVFPTLFALVSIYGLVADAQTIEGHLTWLSGLLPPIALNLVRQQLHSIAATPRTALQWGTAISVLVALWSAAGGSASLIEGLNVAYDVEERRGLIRLRALSLLLSLGLVLFLILSLTLIAAVPNVIAALHLPDALKMASQVTQWALLVALILGVLVLLYRVAPSREAPARKVTPGAIVGAVLWIAISAAFSWYAANWGRFDKTHGALGAVVALLLWLQISCLVVLLGAELDAALERRRAGAGGDRPAH